MDINEVKDRLAQLGYEMQEGDEVTLLFCISRVEEYIKNTCNVTEIPEGLHYKSIDMVCGEFLDTKLSIGQLEGYNVEDNRLIKSIAEGDTTVTYQDGAADSYTAMSEYISSLKAADAELYTYRKIRW